MSSYRPIVRAIAAALVMMTGKLQAGDWPQILGPARNGQAQGESLSPTWPSGGPKTLWRYALGSGYAGVAVSGERVVVFHRVGNQERIECLNASDGKSRWKSDYAASYRPGINPDPGPRCVPLIDSDNVYVFGAAGDLHSVTLDGGKKRWSRALFADYKGEEGYFGAGSTPILVADKLLVNVGGRGAGIVALLPDTGKTLWQTTEEGASYSSPTGVKTGGRDQALFITRLNCVLVDPSSGKATTLFPFGQRGPTVNAATPLVVNGKVFATASYGVGATLSALDSSSKKPIWSSDDALSSQYATPVEHNGFLYGIHGREDVGVAELRCIEAATGKVKWSQRGYGVAHLILSGDKLLIQKVDGKIALAEADPTRYRELASAQISPEPTRAMPALANGRLYVRTGEQGGELLCLQVGER